MTVDRDDALQRGNPSSKIVFDALTGLTEATEPLGVAELQRRLGEPVSSVHRALLTLEASGYGQRYLESARFIPGLMTHHLVHALLNRFKLRERSLPYMRRLAAVTSGAATLNVRLGHYSLRIASAEIRSEYEGRRLGESRLLHTGVSPLALLLFAPDGEIAAYRRFVQQSFPEMQAAAEMLTAHEAVESARAHGHVTGPDRDRDDNAWVSMPLQGDHGEVAAALATSLPQAEVADGARSLMLREVRATVAALQTEIDRDPTLAASPFARLDPEQLRLPVPVET